MKRKHVGTFVLLLGSLVLAGALAAAWATSSSDTTPPSFTLPPGRFGDRQDVTFVYSWSGLWVNKTEVQAFGGNVVSQRGSYTVSGPIEALDQTAGPHGAVMFRSDAQFRFGGSQLNASRIAEGDFSCGNGDSDYEFFVSLETRDVVGMAFDHYNRCELDPHLNPNHQTRFSQRMYGPDFGGSGVPLGSYLWFASVLQGRTLGEGDEIQDISRRQLEVKSFADDMRRTWVVGPREIGGRTLWEVRSEASSHVALKDHDETRYQNQSFLFDPQFPWPVEVDYNETLRQDARDGRVWSEWQHFGFKDARLTPGNATIPWGEVALGLRPTPVAREMSRNHVPASGVSFPSPHLVEDAVRSAENDAALLRFALWKSQNPGFRLVGARFSPTTGTSLGPLWASSAGGTTWSLTYAAPGSDTGYRVDSTRYGTGHVSNTEGDWSLLRFTPDQRFDPGNLPAQSVTFSDVAATWSKVLSNSGSAAVPNYFVWGYGAFQDPFYFQWPYWSPTPTAKLPREMGAGHIRAQPTENDQVRFSSADASVIVVDAATGDIRRATLSAFDPPIRTDLASTPAREAPPTPGAAFPLFATATVAGSIVGAALLAYFFPLVKYSAGQVVAGYAKLHKGKLLDNRYRDHLLQLIKQEPGISPPELHAHVGGGWSTVVYHLGVLEKNGLVSSLIDGRHKRMFPVDTIDHSRRAPVAALRNDQTRALYGLIRADPGLHQRGLAGRIGLSRGATQWHLDRLRRVGLVTMERRGHRTLYFANHLGNRGAGTGIEVA